MKYFKSLILWPDLKSFFEQNIQNLMNSLIIPNLGLNSILIWVKQEREGPSKFQGGTRVVYLIIFWEFWTWHKETVGYWAIQANI